MKKRVFLGVDTSNYTTSLAAVSEDGKLIANIKRLLPVGDGERGLRQSDAVFAHVKAIPELSAKLEAKLASYAPSHDREVIAVGYSSAPRDADGSYMPCFLVGEAVARGIAAACSAEVFSSSHQAGHIMAALYSSDSFDLIRFPFAAFHVSGGTTDVILVNPDEDSVFRTETVGGTKDINAGQAIDRAGVMMGLSFPCGAALEKLAMNYTGDIPRARICVNGMFCNLSGLENKAKEFYGDTRDSAKVAAFVFEFVSNTLYKMSENLRNTYVDIPIVYSGGVMSSVLISKKLSTFGGRHASPEFSSDNAVGCAFLCREKYLRSKNKEVLNGLN